MRVAITIHGFASTGAWDVDKLQVASNLRRDADALDKAMAEALIV